MKSPLIEFRNRISNEFLPAFCNDPGRRWGTDGFKEDWSKISEIDAADFLRGIDGNLLRHEGRGLYRAPRSYASEQFFWSGAKKKIPRPITLWVEPIITVAVIARLHFDLGWPKELIGTQSNDWAFDAAAYWSRDSVVEYIACEIKKTQAEVDQLVAVMLYFGRYPREIEKTPKQRNAIKKLQALRSRHAPFFWAVGPGRLSYAFRLEYGDDGLISFQETAVSTLGYPLGGRSIEADD